LTVVAPPHRAPSQRPIARLLAARWL